MSRRLPIRVLIQVGKKTPPFKKVTFIDHRAACEGKVSRYNKKVMCVGVITSPLYTGCVLNFALFFFFFFFISNVVRNKGLFYFCLFFLSLRCTVRFIFQDIFF